MRQNSHRLIRSSNIYTIPKNLAKIEIGNLSLSDSAKCTQNTVAASTLNSSANTPSPLIYTSGLRQHPAHVATDTVVVEKTLNLTDSRDSDVTVPKLLLSKCHDILLADAANDTLNLLR